MATFEHALIILALMFCVVWPSIFVVVLLDKIRGTNMGSFFGGGRYHLPKNLRPLSWQKHLIRLPLYCVIIPAFAMCCLLILPPLYVIKLGARLRIRFFGRTLEKTEHEGRPNR
jgi:preprotein translocase subunit SecG